MTIVIKNKYTLLYEDFSFKCCVGLNGFTKIKKEGDKKTPRGLFGIGDLYYRRDKNIKPQTKLNCIEIRKYMGWCNDPLNKKYNSLIKVNKKIKHEKLYRKDNKYDILVVIDYNLRKPIPFRGSAIFIHLTKNFKGTAGCIALNKIDLLILLKLVNKKTMIKIF